MTPDNSSQYLACALCPSTDPRPASVTCANGCGRHVCVDHAQPLNPATRGPLVCMDCWETTFRYGQQQMLEGRYQSAPLPIRAALMEQQTAAQPSSRRSFVRIVMILILIIMTGFAMLIMLLMNR